MPSLAVVISFTYCSGVAKPGTTALLRPSMPIEMAPLRLTLAFSSSSTRKAGLACLALTAAIGPAVPPPITSTSTSCSIVFIVSLRRVASAPLQAQAVLEGVRAAVQVLVVDGRAGAVVGEPLDVQHRRVRCDVQVMSDLGRCGDGVDGDVGVAQRRGEVFFKDEEDVARGEVVAVQALAQVPRQPGE